MTRGTQILMFYCEPVVKNKPSVYKTKLFPLFLMLMAMVLHSLQLLIILCVYFICLAFAQNEDQFIYNGFHQANLHLDGSAQIYNDGLLQLSSMSLNQVGHAFYTLPLKFNTSSSAHPLLGLFNFSNIGLATNHILAIELDTVKNDNFGDIDDNHVGIDVNGLQSVEAATAMYFSNKEGRNISLELTSGNPMHLWIDYYEAEKLLNVTLAPTYIPKPNQPLLSKRIDLSQYLLQDMYVGFSASAGESASYYILGWSFNKSGQSQSLDVSKLPPLLQQEKTKENTGLLTKSLVITVILLLITITGAAYILRRKKYEEIREDWEREYGPHRFTYKNLYKATKGFSDKELLGVGGFGKVFRGLLPSSNIQIAVKKISHDSKQGMKEFVAEIISIGRLRHRNLVQLLGYCRRRGELLLVYDYMPNGSLDKFLYSNEKPNLNWFQRYRILRGVASGLLYLHEEWEQVVLHRDVKASNVLLDADLNGRLGDFGLAKLYDHDTNPQTTHLVGTWLVEEGQIEVQGLPTEMILVDRVFQCWRKGAILDASDPRLEGSYVKEEMELVLKLGLFCSQSMPAARPSMRQVMQFLDGDADLPELPHDEACFGTSTNSEAYGLSLFPSSSRGSAPSMFSTDSILRSGR
ncbi:hypothetical protein RGQ29_032960 [Quercus rubra]|uniref:non-specific serine/threonine protein kinase n=1 Tax=Quercus rubra TaxID=3512 RepID=A0AAN7HS62_QUERU|nr:hypothetical protein RGQ29_032960 [Quercus rubra]